MVKKTSQIIPYIHKSLFLLERNAKRSNFNPILNAISDATNCVMIGEASHGTDEFYQHRAEITKRLIEEKGFNIICVEGIVHSLIIHLKKKYYFFNKFLTTPLFHTQLTFQIASRLQTM